MTWQEARKHENTDYTPPREYYEKGHKFKLLEEVGGYYFSKGDIVTLLRDDGTSSPCFINSKGTSYISWYKLIPVEDTVEAEKAIVYDHAYFEYFQELYDNGVELKFSNATDNETWSKVRRGNFLPRDQSPRTDNKYPARYRLASHPFDCPPCSDIKKYREYWNDVRKTHTLLYYTDNSSDALTASNATEYYENYYVFEKGDCRVPQTVATSVSNGSCAVGSQIVACTDTSSTVTSNIATKDYVDEQISKSISCPEKGPTNPNTQGNVMSDKITLELDASCVKQITKEKEVKTEYQAKPTLVAKYFKQNGGLYSLKEFSGKSAMKKAKAKLRDPSYAGCTMVPYVIGKQVRVKIELEEV